MKPSSKMNVSAISLVVIYVVIYKKIFSHIIVSASSVAGHQHEVRITAGLQGLLETDSDTVGF